MHLGIGWSVKDSPDLSYKPGEKENTFAGCIGADLESGQPLARRCDIIGLQIVRLKDTAPEFEHSMCSVQHVADSWLTHICISKNEKLNKVRTEHMCINKQDTDVPCLFLKWNWMDNEGLIVLLQDSQVGRSSTVY